MFYKFYKLKGGFLDDNTTKWLSIAGKKNTVNGASIGDALVAAVGHHARENNGANALRKRLEEEEALKKQLKEEDHRRYNEMVADQRKHRDLHITRLHDEKKRLNDRHIELNNYYEQLKQQHLLDAKNAENIGKDEDEILHKRLYQQVKLEQQEAMAWNAQHTASELARLDQEIHHVTNHAYAYAGAGYAGVTYELQHIRC
jgi:hypothetical protein